ncbi:agamous-like MADS-box protein AGL65 isoform X2 [Cryptomeria japonica]|uniref:agamous-like MADS-box protein AGL65 isoform X2 n=1 Tax=Cryptomeria japonica TaxID=3369 RepID=UPI0027DA4C31|nr:agamous-like MADS-box protein AGL65 isoform X2 [Cryptomeria japonica]
MSRQINNMEEVIARFAQLTPQERAKRKLESLEALKKTFKKLGHDVNIEDFLGASNRTNQELNDELRQIQLQLSNVQKELWYFGNEPDHITTLEQAKAVEGTLHEAIIQMRNLKENLMNTQLMPVAEPSQQFYQSRLCLPLPMEGDHQHQSISWMSTENQQIFLPELSNLILSQRDMDHVENHLTIPPRYVLNGRHSDINETSSQQETCFSELNQGTGLSLQFSNHCIQLQHPCDYFSRNKNFKMEMDRNSQGSFIDFQNCGHETLGIAYDGLLQQMPASFSHAAMSLCGPQPPTMLDGFLTSANQQMVYSGDPNSLDA